jgi:hypothetical protein
MGTAPLTIRSAWLEETQVKPVLCSVRVKRVSLQEAPTNSWFAWPVFATITSAMPSFVISPIATLFESSLPVAMGELVSSVSPPPASPTNSWFAWSLFATITSAMPSFVTSPIATLRE